MVDMTASGVDDVRPIFEMVEADGAHLVVRESGADGGTVLIRVQGYHSTHKKTRGFERRDVGPQNVTKQTSNVVPHWFQRMPDMLPMKSSKNRPYDPNLSPNIVP